ncbi:SIMPL domain-containing protein [Sphingomonas sp. ID0503]|uniref:SIMPL domain-containing protein n=1 Tax=Sphingomonas sp. ID0503 TaxID=3399691 RepID=UPI003AFA3141
MTKALAMFGTMLLAAAPAAAQVAPAAPPYLSGTRLEVSATGSVTRVPNVATINAGVVSQAASAAAAMADNARRMQATLAQLKSAGIEPRDVQTSTIALSPRYEYNDNQPPRITGYQASNQVTVRFRDVAKAGGVLDALVAAGANQIDGPALSVDTPDAALDEARTQTLATARQRGELYARAAGLRIKRIVAINEAGGYEPPRPVPVMAMARAPKSDAVSEIAPGEQKLDVTLNVVFELE